MKQAFSFDKNGNYIEPINLEDGETIPEDCTFSRPPDGLYNPKFVNGEWVGTTREVYEANLPPSQPSEIEILKKQQADLVFTLMLNGVI
jgi:hypothetical protein